MEGPAATSATPPRPDGAQEKRAPKYYGLKGRLLDLATGLPPGEPLPSERVLAAKTGVARETLRSAIRELVIEGRMERVARVGTFPTRPKVAQVVSLTGFTEDMRAQGLEPTSRVLGITYRRADEALAGRLAVKPGARVVRIERLRLADGRPMAVEAAHLSTSRFPQLRHLLDRAPSLYFVLSEHYGVDLAEAEQTIETVPAPPREAGLLGVDVGMPVLLMTRHSFDTDQRPVEWVRSTYRADRYKFVVHLTPPGH